MALCLQDMAAAWEGYNDAYTRFSEDTKRKVCRNLLRNWGPLTSQ